VEFQGRQYRIEPGQLVSVPHFDAEPGSQVVIDRVLMISGDGEIAVGHPFIEGARVEATVVRHFRGPKVLVGKFKRRKGYRRRKGTRDDLTEVEIGAIQTA
jgi:large subunit ribosomal protein L21